LRTRKQKLRPFLASAREKGRRGEKISLPEMTEMITAGKKGEKGQGGGLLKRGRKGRKEIRSKLNKN